MSNQLTHEQLREVAYCHAERLVAKMSLNELKDLALRYVIGSFDNTPGEEDTNEWLLINDIRRVECGDDDSVFEFLVGCGIDDTVAESLSYQSES